MSDFRIYDNGTLFGVQPQSASAREWLTEHVHSEPWQWLGPTLWVDHRMIETLATAIVAAGFNIEES